MPFTVPSVVNLGRARSPHNLRPPPPTPDPFPSTTSLRPWTKSYDNLGLFEEGGQFCYGLHLVRHGANSVCRCEKSTELDLLLREEAFLAFGEELLCTKFLKDCAKMFCASTCSSTVFSITMFSKARVRFFLCGKNSNFKIHDFLRI